MRICWPGFMTCFFAAPANVQDLSVFPKLVASAPPGTRSGRLQLLVAARLREELAGCGLKLLPTYRNKAWAPAGTGRLILATWSSFGVLDRAGRALTFLGVIEEAT